MNNAICYDGHMKKTPITVRAIVQAPIETVWECWTKPQHMSGWAFASDDWGAEGIENDVRVGGRFNTRMFAKDDSVSFDFTGTYTAVKEHQLIEYDMDDGRHVKIVFSKSPAGIEIVETFDPENENPEEMQRSGWQAFLENFKKYAEGR